MREGPSVPLKKAESEGRRGVPCAAEGVREGEDTARDELMSYRGATKRNWNWINATRRNRDSLYWLLQTCRRRNHESHPSMSITDFRKLRKLKADFRKLTEVSPKGWDLQKFCKADDQNPRLKPPSFDEFSSEPPSHESLAWFLLLCRDLPSPDFLLSVDWRREGFFGDVGNLPKRKSKVCLTISSSLISHKPSSHHKP